MIIFSSLRRDQKEAIVLLQTGTFLEYFDLMLYVHMAVLLNELFFPKTDPHTASLLAAFAFCSTYVLRPVGALIFGYIGDRIGRKTTVIFTTLMMALSCIVMAGLPTYEQIGISAAWFVTGCRVLQSLASQGEIIGAEIYLTEITKPPMRYMVVSLTSFSASLGGMIALAIAVSLIFVDYNWRLAFWMGAVIAVIGTMARTRLRETPEFVDMQSRMNTALERAKESGLGIAAEILKKTNHAWEEKINKKTMWAYFFISCGYPACFYLSYIHLGHILKTVYGYTANDIIQQNFILAICQSVSFLTCSLLSLRINPLKILKFKLLVFFPIIFMYPYLYGMMTTPIEIFLFQCFVMAFGVMDVPAAAIFMKHFPVFKRFTSTSLIYAFSRIVIYVITSFGFVYATDYLENWGVWFIMMFISLSFLWGLRYFEKLEKTSKMGAFLRHVEEDSCHRSSLVCSARSY